MLSYTVNPINKFSELQLGEFTEISDKFIEPKLIEKEGKKEVFLIPLPQPSKNWQQVREYLSEEGYKPCKQGTNYLLGVLKEFISTGQHPEVLNQHMIASIDDEEVIEDKEGYKSFFAVEINHATERFTTFEMHEVRNWFHPNSWFIIAEKN